MARFNHHRDAAQLHGLLAGCQKFLFRFTLIGSLAAVLLVKPLCNWFHFPRTGLAEVALACVLLQLWGGLATALCQGLSWFRRLAVIGFLGMGCRLLFCWTMLRFSPLAEWAVLATGMAVLPNLLVFLWKDEIIHHEKPVAPWNRDLLWFFVVSAGCMTSNYLFMQGDALVAQRYFSKAHLDAYSAAAVFTRALPITVGPLLAVLFTSRSSERTGDALREQMKLMGIYAVGLVVGLGGLLLFRDYCLKFTNRYSPESSALIMHMAIPMVFVGLIQALGTWALASRWIKLAVVYGVLGLAYWLGLFVFGNKIEQLPQAMTGLTAICLVILFAMWLRAMRRPHHPSANAA